MESSPLLPPPAESSATGRSSTSSDGPTQITHPEFEAVDPDALIVPGDDGGGGEYDFHAPPVLADLPRHLRLFDLVCIGVGGTVGSGIFVLCGLIARDYAGPATFLSWAAAGLAACLSGFCCAELSGKIPEAGSAYSYAAVTIGEYASFVAAACLTLNYVGSASAVARSWGDKVAHWSAADLGTDHWLSRTLDPGYGVNPAAFLVSAGSVSLLLWGVQESKYATNLFTALKVGLIVFMVVVGMGLADADNFEPLIPPEFGVAGVFRGATSCFFGYIGFDEACCLAGEAIDPQRNMPRAVLWTIGIVTLLYMLAASVLVGMQPYADISGESGFPDAFRANGVEWAAQIASAGEVVTLPIVVLISILAQPRLQWAVAKDGLLPAVLAEVDSKGNLWKGTLYSGIIMVAIATFVPFSFLDDTISAGILAAFCITNWSVISLRYMSSNDGMYSPLLDRYMMRFNVESLASGLVSRHALHLTAGKVALGLLTVGLVDDVRNILSLPLGSISLNDGYYHAPLVPFLPLLGIYVNWYLVAQLELTGIALLLVYIGAATLFYYTYGLRHTRCRRTQNLRMSLIRKNEYSVNCGHTT